MKTSLPFAILAGVAIFVPIAGAHFKLFEPPSWIEESNLGDPQKLGPCGGTSVNSGTLTNVVTKATGGQKLHLKWIETVYHPGHYRISLAVKSRDQLPPDPPVQTRETDKGPRSVSTVIQNPVKIPVLVDGLFPHTSRVTTPFETDIELPNITCAHCTLQIVEFMAEHGLNPDGGYSYHHCADLQITADPKAAAPDPAWLSLAR